MNSCSTRNMHTQTQYKEFQSKAYITTKMVECPLNISGTQTCKHQSNHASRWQRNLCNACIDELNPPSDGGKHCSSWWVSLSFKKFYPLAVSEAITTPHMPHELIPPPKTVSSGCRPEQHSSACLSVGATCRWQTRTMLAASFLP
ncbi:hypothetical protein C4D60_Mb03t13220 [Musa balbisiana]|uniref:Uncharacterized protein n=1 Tax=Musa balbisiana TaxID=52838 RepID=A0A4S8J9K2_MUSBA|nr:hypothetical protein C4D60_Mb03t13220 [Musa balbisiana]